MAEEEVPFKSIKITLSEDALDMLDALRKVGSFRSYSMTVEECIRSIFDVSQDITGSIQHAREMGTKPISPIQQSVILQRLSLRLKRFIRPPKEEKKKQ